MRILCLGDSNTYGYDPRGYFGGRYGAEDRWPDLLAKKTGWEVINAGTCGARIPHHLDPLPEAGRILVMLGTNDLLQGAYAKEAAARMEAFLARLLLRFPAPVLIAPPPMKRGAWVATDALAAESIRLAEAYETLARKLDIPFVDTRSWNIGLAFDGVHFTEAGHHAFAARLHAYLTMLNP